MDKRIRYPLILVGTLAVLGYAVPGVYMLLPHEAQKSVVDFLTGIVHKDLASVDVKAYISTDSIRHYYPVKQGEVLKIAYPIVNKSNTEVVIQGIQTSCGCLASRDQLPIFIMPKDTGYVHVDFDTSKNTGYVSHYIQCFGNFKNAADSVLLLDAKGNEKWASYVELHFDTNVVPPADYNRDYEDVWHEQNGGLSGTIRDFVDGKSSQKGYYSGE